MTPGAVFIVGPPCAGKTTYAKNLAQENGIEVLSTDELKHLYYPRWDFDQRIADAAWSVSGAHGLAAYLAPFERRMADFCIRLAPHQVVVDIGGPVGLGLPEDLARSRATCLLPRKTRVLFERARRRADQDSWLRDWHQRGGSELVLAWYQQFASRSWHRVLSTFGDPT
ncbi:AAA family ATPase [Salinispora mooreana]|uniref:AAA family ATPase n=1 Tax=Salinispora mooreana TaxID=999545 RepID=UPI0013A596B0